MPTTTQATMNANNNTEATIATVEWAQVGLE
jgi:hypothetical protein